MSVFQIVFVVVAASQVLAGLRRFLRAHQIIALVFAAAWTAAIVVVLNPGLSTRVATLVGIGRGVDLVTYALLTLFLWAHYQHYLRYKRLENQVTSLVREMAVDSAVRPGPLGPNAAAESRPS